MGEGEEGGVIVPSGRALDCALTVTRRLPTPSDILLSPYGRVKVEGARARALRHGVVLAGNDPGSVVGVVRLSRASYRTMRQNLAWAAGYDIIAIPLAAGALSWVGIDLAPAVGAILMSLSTTVVALNAQLLRRVQLRPARNADRIAVAP